MNPISHPLHAYMEAHPVAASAALLDQCFKTVEYYQPLYGIAENDAPLRSCKDRALVIESALRALGGYPRLIDFGSSLGYFPFYFADRGLSTTGWDVSAANTAMAQACKAENGLAANFFAKSLDLDTLAALGEEEFDVALILSVLHHVVAKSGLPYAQRLMAGLLQKIPVLVLELAHRAEDVNYPWRAAQPVDPLEILATCGPVQVLHLGDFPSHLSGSTRPLFLVRRAGFSSF